MKRYKQLTSEQRYQISGLLKAGCKQSQIAVIRGGMNFPLGGSRLVVARKL